MEYGRTDLAVEAAAAFGPEPPPGVGVEQLEEEGVRVTRMQVRTPQAARRLGRPPGRYITVELPAFPQPVDPAGAACRLVARELAALLPREGTVLVAGLGNRQITPDALGPRTCRQILATRHLAGPLARQAGLEGLRPVAALAPGVLGQTGMEAWEVLTAVVERIRPAAVIAVDALAARELSRLGSTVQLCDTGISPGSGVLNARRELSPQTLGVPVAAVGIPTVVDGASLARALTGGECPANAPAAGMMVTPRQIDEIIQRGADCLAQAINQALQPTLTPQELQFLAG